MILVIIPMFGKEEYTDKCIELLRKNAGVEHNILVVDDCSEKPYKCREFLRLDKNLGFTGATNAGILWAQRRDYDYVLLLNNDTEPEPNFLKHLVDTMDSDPTIGIVASVRRHPKKSPQPIELCGSDLIRGYQYFVEERDLPDMPIDCNWVPLCSGLLRMDMIREIGLLDKRFRTYCSDSSYCLWAKINGWKVMFHPKSIVTHHLSVTCSANKEIPDLDQKKFLEKLAGLDYQQIMIHMPLDGEAKTFGRLTFEVYEK